MLKGGGHHDAVDGAGAHAEDAGGRQQFLSAPAGIIL